MSRYKSLIKICSLFILLIIAAITPIALAQLESKKLIDRIHTEVIKEDEYKPSNALRTTDKINIIVSSKSQQGGVVTRQEKTILDNFEKDILRHEIVNQLEKLKELNVISNIDFTSNSKIRDISKITFMDISTPQDVVNVWKAEIDFFDFSVNVWMDKDTSKIYEYDIYSKGKNIYSEEDSLESMNYMKYLEIPLENVDFKGTVDDREGHYHIYGEDGYQFNYIHIKQKRYLSFFIEY